MSLNIKIKLVSKDSYSFGIIPTYATDGSAGLDLYASLEENIVFAWGDIKKVPTGISIHINDNRVAGFVFPRSGLSSKHGITLVNSVGVIDSDYTGEIICPMINLSKDEYILKPGDRIAQIVFMPIYIANLIVTDELQETKRGSGGFGSTGR